MGRAIATTARPHVEAGARRLRREWDDRRIAAHARRVAPAVLRQVSGLDAADDWVLGGREVTEAEVAVMFVRGAGARPAAVLKVATTVDAERSLRREADALGALHSDARLAAWASTLPPVIAEGRVDGQLYVIIGFVEGQSAALAARDAASRVRVQRIAAEAIGGLHRRTAVTMQIGEDDLDRWLRRASVVQGAAAPVLDARRTARALDRLCDAVRQTLGGRSAEAAWVHGDFWLGNVLLSPDGSRVTGIIDWDQAGAAELPILDLLHLVVYTRRLADRHDVGPIVFELLGDGAWTTGELSLLRAAQHVDDPDAAYMRAALCLYWLRHIAGNLAQSQRYARNRLWMRRNVEPVIAFFGDGRDPGALA